MESQQDLKALELQVRFLGAQLALKNAELSDQKNPRQHRNGSGETAAHSTMQKSTRQPRNDRKPTVKKRVPPAASSNSRKQVGPKQAKPAVTFITQYDVHISIRGDFIVTYNEDMYTLFSAFEKTDSIPLFVRKRKDLELIITSGCLEKVCHPEGFIDPEFLMVGNRTFWLQTVNQPRG